MFVCSLRLRTKNRSTGQLDICTYKNWGQPVIVGVEWTQREWALSTNNLNKRSTLMLRRVCAFYIYFRNLYLAPCEPDSNWMKFYQRSKIAWFYLELSRMAEENVTHWDAKFQIQNEHFATCKSGWNPLLQQEDTLGTMWSSSWNKSFNNSLQLTPVGVLKDLYEDLGQDS